MEINSLDQWKYFHKIILGLVLPIVFVLCVLYLLLCLSYPFFFIFVGILYFFVAGISRETFWISDYHLSKIVGYHEMQSYLWTHIRKPPTKKTYLKMYYFWLLLFIPAWECRVFRLKRMYGKYENHG